MVKVIINGYFLFGVVMIFDVVVEVFESDMSGKGVIGLGYIYFGYFVGVVVVIECFKEIECL